MNNLVLDKNTTNTYSFNVKTEGVGYNDLNVFFYIDIPDMRLSFKCKLDGDNYICKVPILTNISNKIYSCGLIAYVLEGYYFEPFQGKIEVTGKIVKVTAEPVMAVKAKEVKEQYSVVADIAIPSEDVINVVEDDETISKSKDASIASILQEFGYAKKPNIKQPLSIMNIMAAKKH